MSNIVNYDKEQDILYVHKGDKEADSLPIGDFIVEFSHSNKVVGMEILNASQNLSMMLDEEVSKKDLESIIEAQVALQESKRMAVVLLKFVYKKAGKKVKNQVSVNMPSSVPKVSA